MEEYQRAIQAAEDDPNTPEVVDPEDDTKFDEGT